MYSDSMELAIAQLYINNKLIAEKEAKDYRPNLENIHPDGHCGYFFDLKDSPLDEGDLVSVKLSKANEFLKNSNTIFLIKKICYIHIGMHKTGTSSIQEYFYRNKTTADILYPNLGDANHSVPLFSIFYNKPENYYIHIINQLSKDEVYQYNMEMKNLLVKQIHTSNKENILISGEDLIYLEIEDLKNLKIFFESYYENVKIIAYARTLNDYLSSALPENLKNIGDTEFNLMNLFPNYKKIFSKFIEIFGTNNVKIYEYNRYKFEDNDIVSDFCSKINTKKSNQTILMENKSLTLEAVSFLFIFYKFFPNTITGAENRIININFIDKLSYLEGTKFRLCNNVLKPILEVFSDDFFWMREEIGIEMDDTKTEDSSKCVSCKEDLFQVAIENIGLLFKLVNNKELIAKIDKDNISLNDVATLTNEIRNQI